MKAARLTPRDVLQPRVAVTRQELVAIIYDESLRVLLRHRKDIGVKCEAKNLAERIADRAGGKCEQ